MKYFVSRFYRKKVFYLIIYPENFVQKVIDFEAHTLVFYILSTYLLDISFQKMYISCVIQFINNKISTSVLWIYKSWLIIRTLLILTVDQAHSGTGSQVIVKVPRVVQTVSKSATVPWYCIISYGIIQHYSS